MLVVENIIIVSTVVMDTNCCLCKFATETSEELEAHITMNHSDIFKKVNIFYLSVSLFFYCQCDGN